MNKVKEKYIKLWLILVFIVTIIYLITYLCDSSSLKVSVLPFIGVSQLYRPISSEDTFDIFGITDNTTSIDVQNLGF